MTVKESRIIAEYAETHNLIPQLSIPTIGQYNFRHRETGKYITTTMLTMRAEVEAARDLAKQTKKRRQS